MWKTREKKATAHKKKNKFEHCLGREERLRGTGLEKEGKGDRKRGGGEQGDTGKEREVKRAEEGGRKEV